MFVEAKPGGELIKMLKNTEEKKIGKDVRIKFVEKWGKKNIDSLMVPDPFRKNCPLN